MTPYQMTHTVHRPPVKYWKRQLLRKAHCKAQAMEESAPKSQTSLRLKVLFPHRRKQNEKIICPFVMLTAADACGSHPDSRHAPSCNNYRDNNPKI